MSAPGDPDQRTVGTAAPPPPDGGEPMGARDDRPAMLGKRFRITLLSGAMVGAIIALLGHALVDQLWVSRGTNSWSWTLAAIGGFVVGGAVTYSCMA